ncbi:site-specific integrase [Amycolatopsis mediterranei]|uniref:site-specific integrase n=1 Tax=Amycolatopsis mediterranei TaxID=33910 RepID=UPI00343936A3
MARLLVITAAWTGCRWGELAALHRDNLDLDAGWLVVDAEVGSLHESRGRRWLGPPKTPSSARTIVLPPFLVRLLGRHLETHPFEFVFTNACGTWLWRSSFDRRVLRPAIDGGGRAAVRLYAVQPGLTFHGLRHSHKTWLIAGGAPEIAQARRLGHHLPNRVVEVYSHVAPEVETRLLADLRRRWLKATRSP